MRLFFFIKRIVNCFCFTSFYSVVDSCPVATGAVSVKHCAIIFVAVTQSP